MVENSNTDLNGYPEITEERALERGEDVDVDGSMCLLLKIKPWHQHVRRAPNGIPKRYWT